MGNDNFVVKRINSPEKMRTREEKRREGRNFSIYKSCYWRLNATGSKLPYMRSCFYNRISAMIVTCGFFQGDCGTSLYESIYDLLL